MDWLRGLLLRLAGKPAEAPQVNRTAPAISAVYGADIKPLISWWQSQEQRLRDQLEVQRSTANSAREALVMCEARCKSATDDRDRLRDALEHAKCDAAEAQKMLVKERASHAGLLDEHNLRTLERDRARFELERIKATMGSATTVPPALVAGSADAIKEAVRLLTGFNPQVCGNPAYNVKPYWASSGHGSERFSTARMALLGHLEELQPAAMVRP